MNDMRQIGPGLYLWTFHESDRTWRGEITDDVPNSTPLHVETGHKSKVSLVGAMARWLQERKNQREQAEHDPAA